MWAWQWEWHLGSLACWRAPPDRKLGTEGSSYGRGGWKGGEDGGRGGWRGQGGGIGERGGWGGGEDEGKGRRREGRMEGRGG